MDRNKKSINIDLGCGKDKQPDHLGVDIRRKGLADVIASIKQLPFKSDSVDRFHARHVLEHFSSEDIFVIINNVYRCLRSGGEFHVIVPHFTNPSAGQIDHKTYWSYNSPTTISEYGLHEELIEANFKLVFRRLHWMRKDYTGKLPLLLWMMNRILNASPKVMERFFYMFGGVYELEFVLQKTSVGVKT